MKYLQILSATWKNIRHTFRASWDYNTDKDTLKKEKFIISHHVWGKLLSPLFHMNTQSCVLPLVRAREWEFPQATWIIGMGSGIGTLLHDDGQQFVKMWQKALNNWVIIVHITEWVITLVCDCWEVLVTLAVHPLLPPRRKRVQMHSQPESGPDRKPSPPHGPAPPLELRKNDRNCTQTCQLDHITCLTTVASA